MLVRMISVTTQRYVSSVEEADVKKHHYRYSFLLLALSSSRDDDIIITLFGP